MSKSDKNKETDKVEISKAELESLRESEQRLMSIIDKTSAFIYMKDLQGKYILINRQFEKLLNIEKKDIVGKTDNDIFPKEIADTFRENDLKVIQRGKTCEFEENAPDKNGLRTYISIKFPLFDARNEIYAVCSISNDITARQLEEETLETTRLLFEELVKERTADLQKLNELLQVEIESRKLIEENLRISEEKFRSAALCTADLIWQGDVRDDSLIWYGDIDDCLGYEPMEFPRTVSGHMENIHPDDKSNFLKEVEKAVATGGDFSTEYRIRCKDGTYRYWNERGKAIGFENNKAVEWVGSATDITQQKMDKENLIKSEKEYKSLSLELMEKNTALKVLLEQRMKDQSVMEQNILHNIKSLVRPYITKLKNNTLSSEARANVNLIESNLEEIVSPFARKLTSRQLNFSARELEVADLVRSGKQGKEIADILNLSLQTINTHRKAIRRKLGLTGKGSNLRSTLIAMSEK